MYFINNSSKFKPLYKKFCRLRQNVQNRTKLFKFKKKKWKDILQRLRKNKRFKKKIYNFDHFIYYKPHFILKLKKKFRYNLFERQKFSLLYGKLTNYYLKSVVNKSLKYFSQFKKKLSFSNTISVKNFFVGLLESRIDIILYRSYFVTSIRKARQIISHRCIKLNNIIVKDSSYLVKKGDIICINKYFDCFSLVKQNFLCIPPKYLQINYKTFQIYVITNIKVYKTNIYPYRVNINSVLKSYIL